MPLGHNDFVAILMRPLLAVRVVNPMHHLWSRLHYRTAGPQRRLILQSQRTKIRALMASRDRQQCLRGIDQSRVDKLQALKTYKKIGRGCQ